MKLIDLTRTITDRMAVYPGDPAIAITQVASVDHEGFTVHKLDLNSQVGTHVETQNHAIPGNALIDEPLDRFIGRAAIIDVPLRPLKIEDFEDKLDIIERNEFLILRSHYDGVGIDPTDKARAFVDEQLAQWMVERKIRLFGIDCFDFDPTKDLRAHKVFLNAGVLILEGLANLDQVTEEEAYFFAIPLKIEGVEASPCRAFILEGGAPHEGENL
jgi:kynurenine formamidase